MILHAVNLIDQSIDDLRALATIFADEIQGLTPLPSSLTPEARAAKEALLTIGVLLPKLQAARQAQAKYISPPQRCVSCED